MIYIPKGPALDFWVQEGRAWGPAPTRFREILFVGPRDTGKSLTVAKWIHRTCIEASLDGIDNLRVLIARQTMRSLRESTQPTFERKVVLAGDAYWHRILKGPKANNRTHYDYPGRTPAPPHIALGGLDEGDKHLSSEWDIVWLEEAKQIPRRTIDDIRGCMRNNALGYHCIVMTTNPSSDFHHLNQDFPAGYRQAPPGKGSRLRLLSRHEDNPTVTEDYLETLRAMHGAAYKQFYLGEWAGEEGRVWPQYDPEIHLLDRVVRKRSNGSCYLVHPAEEHEKDPSIIDLNWLVASMDFGFRGAGCFGVWGVDSKGRAYLIAEVYRTGWHQDEWAEVIAEIQTELTFRAIFCDAADASFISYLNAKLGHLHKRNVGYIARKADKSKGKPHGLDAVRWALGEGRLFFLREEHRMRYWPDPDLKRDGKPTNSTREIPSYVFESAETGTESQKQKREKDERPYKGCADHGCDMIEYFSTFMFGARQPDLTPMPPPLPALSPYRAAMLGRKAG